MGKPLPKDMPLQCRVRGQVLTIKIGVDTLAFADKERTGVKINNAKGYAGDVVNWLNHEDEEGASPLTDFLDKAMDEVRESGSEFIDYEDAK